MAVFEGEHTIICRLNVSWVNRQWSFARDSRNLAVSRIHLLKRMTLELNVIHVLQERIQYEKDCS